MSTSFPLNILEVNGTLDGCCYGTIESIKCGIEKICVTNPTAESLVRYLML